MGSLVNPVHVSELELEIWTQIADLNHFLDEDAAAFSLRFFSSSSAFFF